jgi:hypothetical protein
MYPPLYKKTVLHVTAEPVPMTDRDVEVFPFSARAVDEDGNPITLVNPGASLEVRNLTTGAAVTGKATLVSYSGRTAWIRVQGLTLGEFLEIGVLLHRSDQGRKKESLLAVTCVA